MKSLSGLPTTSSRPSSTTTTKCPRLPPEIWLRIFSVGRFDADGDFWSTYSYPTMARICRCCTLFCDLIRPVLYCNFNSVLFTLERGGDYCSVVKFARTVCQSPVLSSMVRRVYIQGVSNVNQMPPPTSVKADDPEHPMASVLIQRARELGMSFEYRRWYTDNVFRIVAFDLVALVLAQLPMMHTLHLSWQDSPSMHAIPEPRQGWPWIRSIRKMMLHSSTGHYNLDTRIPSRTHNHCFGSALPFLRSGGRLTKLSLIDTIGPRLALPLPNLLEVTLERCQFRPRELANLLGHCDHLLKFVYMGTRQAPPLSPREIIDALEPSHASLEVLGIELPQLDDFTGQRGLPSLKHFTALKTFYVDMNTLWGLEAAKNIDSPPHPDLLLTTMLPDSIEDVALFCTKSHYESLGLKPEAHLRRLAWDRRDKGAFPHLRTLRGKDLSPVEHTVDDEDEIFPRLAVFREATAQLSGDGVVVILSGESDSDVEFEDIIS